MTLQQIIIALSILSSSFLCMGMENQNNFTPTRYSKKYSAKKVKLQEKDAQFEIAWQATWGCKFPEMKDLDRLAPEGKKMLLKEKKRRHKAQTSANLEKCSKKPAEELSLKPIINYNNLTYAQTAILMAQGPRGLDKKKSTSHFNNHKNKKMYTNYNTNACS